VLEAATRDSRLPHIGALDGIRAIAVIGVLLFHGGVSWAGGGFLGVDAFFVLSGFLIATLVLLELERSGTLGLKAFWCRRARRLLPALLVLLVGVAAYAAYAAPADTIRSIRGDSFATLSYVANWRFLFAGHGYFAQGSAPSPLLHTWSLAIEEQFYLVFPLVIFVFVRRTTRPALVLGLGAAILAAASAIEMSSLSGNVDRVYYGTDTRAQSLLIGVALAALYVSMRNEPRHARRSRASELASSLVGPLAFVIALALAARLTGATPALYHYGLLVFSAAVGLVVLDVTRHPTGLPGRALGWRPLAAIGVISYGLYVYHWPLFLYLDHDRTGLTGGALLAVRFAATFAAAVVSYQLLERPVRLGALRVRRLPVVVPATAIAAVAALVAFTVVVVPGTSLTGSEEVAAAAAAPQAAPIDTVRANARPGRVVPANRPVKVLVVGDSVGVTLSQGMSSVSGKYGVDLVDRSQLGCGIVRGNPFRYFGAVQAEPPECASWPRDWANDVAQLDPDVVLVVVGRWEVMDRVHDGDWTRIGDAPFDDYLDSELATALSTLSSHGAVVAFATAPYYKRGEQPNGSLYPEDEPWRVDRWNQLLRAFVGQGGPTALVDLGGLLSPQGKLAYSINGVTVRSSDGVHITPQGGRWLAPQLLPSLTQLVQRPPTTTVATTIPRPSTTRRR
jgi:peptidoglycan/LPS O-acetylase OafA/YrhL